VITVLNSTRLMTKVFLEGNSLSYLIIFFREMPIEVA
jgi:hypothetical protein